MEQIENESVMLNVLNNNEDSTNNTINTNDDSFDLELITSEELVVNTDEENQILLAEQNVESNETINYYEEIEISENIGLKERQYWIDALRILASYMVVLVNSSSYAINDVHIFSSSWYGLMFWDAMSRACVPLFIMISGTLFLNPKKDIPISKIYKKYIFRILKCIIFWNVFYGTVVKYLVNPFKTQHKWGYNIVTDFITDVLYGKFHLWYLYMGIGLYMVIPILRAITSNMKTLKYYLGLGVTVSYFIPFISNLIRDILPSLYIGKLNGVFAKFMICITIGFSIYYTLGYFLSVYEIKKKSILNWIYIFGLVNLFFTYGIKMILSIKKQEEYIFYDDYNAFNVFSVAVAIFLFFKYYVKELLNKLLLIKRFKILLLALSNLSFGVYLIHIFYFEIFFALNFHSYTFNPFIFSPIFALFIWVCGAVTVYFMKQVPILRNFV